MADWVIIVDDDAANLKLAGHSLSKNGIRVTAFLSGQKLLEFIQDHDVPDLVLLDVKMPDMDGFETLKRFRKIEKAKDVPVIFLTADENRGSEMKGLSLGAMDFIRKPFIPEVLTLRVRHMIQLDQFQKQLENEVIKKTEEAKTDAMTSMLNKVASEEALDMAVRESDGILMMIDLDSFKLVNDIHGHDMGDQVLISFSKLLRSHMREGDIIGRIGGDEFVAFLQQVSDPQVAEKKIVDLNRQLTEEAKKLMGEDMDIPLGVSAGAVHVRDRSSSYEELKKKADEALYSVKQNGKHGISFFHADEDGAEQGTVRLLEEIRMIYAERSVATGAFVVGKEAFRAIYQYQERFLINYPWDIHIIKFLLTAEDNQNLDELTERFVQTAASVLRRSDVLTVHGKGTVLAIFPKVTDESWKIPVERALDAWEDLHVEGVTIEVDSEAL